MLTAIEQLTKSAILTALGFEFNQATLRHTHKLTNEIEFDFSSSSIEGIVCVIIGTGYESGRRDLKSEFKNLMD